MTKFAPESKIYLSKRKLKTSMLTNTDTYNNRTNRDSLKTEWVVLVVLIFMAAAVMGWSYFYFKKIAPAVVTEKTAIDSDDPAIWINPADPSKSLIIGTDKGKNDGSRTGSLFVFDLDGKIQQQLTVKHLKRPNNVDVEYGFAFGDSLIDIAVCTERYANEIRVFRLPDMQNIDGEGIKVFEGEKPTKRLPMGIGLYKSPHDGAIFAIVSRKDGESGSYLWQYQLIEENGQVVGKKVREFGEFFDHDGEIEAVAVDDELGYVYYSDEYFGVRKYHADPDHPDAAMQLGVLATEHYRRDREGIAVIAPPGKPGYIVVSDQQANLFHFYPREGAPENMHYQPRIKTVRLSTKQTDGIDATHVALGSRFPNGLFVAMSDNRTFQFYDLADLLNN